MIVFPQELLSQFPVLPEHKATWQAIYMEPIMCSGERITVAVIAFDSDGCAALKTLSASRLTALFGDQADGTDIKLKGSAAMLHLVTNQQAGEPELLGEVMHASLELRSLAGKILKTVDAPFSGWTHEQLEAVAVEHEAITRDGADGYLGGQWVGSTEI